MRHGSSDGPGSRAARVSRWVLFLAAAFAGLGGCAVPETRAPAGDIKTESDRTDADRRALARLELASAYFGRNQLDIALDEVKQALVARPDMGEAMNLRGLIYASMGELELAEDSFRRAMTLLPHAGIHGTTPISRLVPVVNNLMRNDS